MPKKKSIRRVAQHFQAAIDEILGFVAAAETGLSKAHVSRVYDAAAIALYRDFEEFVLGVLVGAINNDTKTVSSTLGVRFPKHLTDEVCRYLITGPSYFDFKGRDGLLKRTQQYVPKGHFFHQVLKKPIYKPTLERLCALRNLAAHGSPQSRRTVLEAIGQARIGSAGSWLKAQGRLEEIAKGLKALAAEVGNEAPY